MTKTITLRGANLAYVPCTRDVDAGQEYLIISDKNAVAHLMPAAGPSPAQQAALTRTRARMDEGWPIEAVPLDRDARHRR